MFCRNCGTEIKDGAKFCPRCGKAVGSSAQRNGSQAQQNGTAQQGANHRSHMQGGPAPRRPKKSKKKIIIPVAAAGAVVIVSVGAFAMTRSNLFKSKFTDPTDYYKSVEKKAVEKAAASIEKAGARQSDSAEITMNVSLGGAAVSMMGLSGADSEAFEALNDLEIKMEYGQSDELTGAEVGLYSYGDRILSANAVVDMDNDELYIQLPEVSPDCLWMDLTSDDISSGMSPGTLSAMSDMPDMTNFSDMLTLYTNTALDSVEDVEREDDELSVEGVDQDAVLLTVTMEEEQLQDLFTGLMEAMKDDESLKEYIVWFGDVAIMTDGYTYSDYDSGEDFYDEFLAQLDYELEAMGEESYFESCSAEMKVWVNSDGEIIGRTLTLSEDGEDMEVFNYQLARDKDDFGLLLTLGDPDDEYSGAMQFSGSGTMDGDLASGTFTLESYDEVMGELEISDYDTKAAEEGYLNGTFTVKGGSGTDMDGYGVKITSEDSEDSSTQSYSIVANDVELATLNLDIKWNSGYTPEIPDDGELYDVTDYDDMSDYEDSMDPYSLLESFEENPFLALLLEEMY